jgi:hypothetical protein
MIQSEKQPLGMTRTGFRDEWWPDEGERGAATAQAATERSGRERRKREEREEEERLVRFQTFHQSRQLSHVVCSDVTDGHAAPPVVPQQAA